MRGLLQGHVEHRNSVLASFSAILATAALSQIELHAFQNGAALVFCGGRSTYRTNCACNGWCEASYEFVYMCVINPERMSAI